METIIITGATSGIGFQCAVELARRAPDHRIIIPARNLYKAEAILEKIKLRTGHQHLKAMVMDLGSLDSIHQFVETFKKEKLGRISILINNAGIQNIGQTTYTSDGFEETFGVNHLGAFALTIALLPFLKSDGHILFTSSETHDPALKTPIEPPVYTSAMEIAYPKESSEKMITIGHRRYSTSKLCNIMTVYALQKKLAGTQIRVNAYDPGMTPGTGLSKSYSIFMRFLWKNILPVLTLFKKNVHTPSQAGKNLAVLAISEKYQHLKGIYFSNGQVVRSSKDSYNECFQNDLWTQSLALTQQNFVEHFSPNLS
ncbi:SDR family NAD(P)-dependent oxidoreductase [Dyadobacter tibetensis]|uniref:SDR family NAD(P)-dependent oxidoreductase n=1 Tax=Dyadobacter tibetensis TaxID=1211851 RepID=UPI0004713F6A|nr:SDR family NAD(P)-dependent oxidoreductase [Dyadobacter tibetensis]